MPIYQVEASETVYYTLFVKSNSPEEAQEFVNHFDGDWNKHIVDGDYFEITDINEVEEKDVYFLVLDVKEENDD
jgi:hypothetical protein